jgi:protein-tyrosine phosphatase
VLLTSAKKVCFVCLGNIIRSPLAKSLFVYHTHREGIGYRYEVDSAGTSDWHVGEPPDPRMRRLAAQHGVPHDGRARQFRISDFDRFDLILVMDEENYDDLRLLGPTPQQFKKIHYLRDFDPAGGPSLEVPDPYYGGREAFEQVYEVIDRSVRGLIKKLEKDQIEGGGHAA